jgi:hypothetical protein
MILVFLLCILNNIQTLKCGWGKLDEIPRLILNFRKSGKIIVAYLPQVGEKKNIIIMLRALVKNFSV